MALLIHLIKKTFILLSLLNGITAVGQEYTISGEITDEVYSEPLIGATIRVDSSGNGTVANEQGFYYLKLPKGKHILTISYIGYTSVNKEINISKNSVVNFRLSTHSVLGEEIIVTSKNIKKNIEGVETGTTELNMKEIKKLPALLGEADFLRIVKLTPGVQSGSDADMGFYVRGGGADQNLILLDNVPIYNPSHVLGIFSVFNSDAIRSTKLIKSGMPANYGGRLSSILDFSSQNGSLTKTHLNGHVGLISSKIKIEGPIIKDMLSFNVSLRRSYLDEVVKPLMKPIVPGSRIFYENTKYYFYDINSKLHFRLNKKNRINITYYQGKDQYKLSKLPSGFENSMNWGNRLGSAIWNHSFNPNWKISTTVGYSEYYFGLNAYQEGIDMGLKSDVKDYLTKTEVINARKNNQIIKFGWEFINHVFRPNNIDASTGDIELNYGSNRELNACEGSLFYNHEFDLLHRMRLNIGTRYTYYAHIGPYIELKKNQLDEITDTTFHKKNGIIKTYNAPEPRISLRYLLNKNSSVKASFTQNYQYIHMASSAAVTLPTDVWLPSTGTIRPQRSSQYSLGYFNNFNDNKYISSINIYYKNYHNQIELLYGILNNYNDNIFEESMTFGSGSSYGGELFLQKAYGNFNGWIGYTLSWTNRKFDEINRGKIYPAKYDRRHEIKIIAAYEFSKKWILSGTFVFASGNAFTLPEYKYIIEGNLINGFGEKNSFRMPAYHRLDLSLTYIAKKTEKFESSFNFSIFNIYNRANPYYVIFNVTGNVYEYNLKITPSMVSILPIIPSVSYNFRF